MVLNSQITRSSLKPQNHRGAVTDALRLVMQFRQIGVETGRAADEVWQTETRRTELGTRRQSARAPRSHSASRWRSPMSHQVPPHAAPAAPGSCGAAAGNALATYPNTPGNTCATFARKPQSPRRRPG